MSPLDRIWFFFRGLPVWAQVAGWILLFWALVPLLIWRTSWGDQMKLIASGVFVLLLVVVAMTDSVRVPSGNAASDSAVAVEDEEPDADNEVVTDEPKDDGKRDNSSRDGDDTSSEPDDEREKRLRQPSAYLVTRVVDGDTIEVRLRGGRIEDVRLIGVDTPETVHPTVGVECFGPAAANFTKSHLEGESVRLEYDVERRDRYGRLLAYVWLDGVMFNKTLVARGFASVSTYPPNVRYVDRFLDAQREARSHDRGLWAGCTAEVDPEPQEKPAPVSGVGGNCDPNYSGACIPSYPPDLDCPEVGATDFRSTGSDPHGFDGDADGSACES